MYTLRPSFVALIVPALFLVACSQGSKSNAVDYTLSVEQGIGAGGLVNTATIQIDANGDFIWAGVYGEMEGQATQTDSETWDLSVTAGRGAYEALAGGSGTLSAGSAGEYAIDGEASTESLFVSGRVYTPAELDALFEESCDNAAVYFSQGSKCGVTVTVDGVELGPITPHYHQPDAFCDSALYDPAIFGGSYVESASSQLICTTIQGLVDPAGNPVEPFEQCESAVAILEKNREYSYSMVWENGETAEGTFVTGAGCTATFVCPPAPANEEACAGSDAGSDEKITANTVMVQELDRDGGAYVEVDAPFPLELDREIFVIDLELLYARFGNTRETYLGVKTTSQSYDLSTMSDTEHRSFSVQVYVDEYGLYRPYFPGYDGSFVVEHDEAAHTLRVDFISAVFYDGSNLIRLDGYVEATYDMP